MPVLTDIWRTSGAAQGVEDNKATITCSAIGNIAPDSWTWIDPNSTLSTEVSNTQYSLINYYTIAEDVDFDIDFRCMLSEYDYIVIRCSF